MVVSVATCKGGVEPHKGALGMLLLLGMGYPTSCILPDVAPTPTTHVFYKTYARVLSDSELVAVAMYTRAHYSWQHVVVSVATCKGGLEPHKGAAPGYAITAQEPTTQFL